MQEHNIQASLKQIHRLHLIIIRRNVFNPLIARQRLHKEQRILGDCNWPSEPTKKYQNAIISGDKLESRQTNDLSKIPEIMRIMLFLYRPCGHLKRLYLGRAVLELGGTGNSRLFGCIQ